MNQDFALLATPANARRLQHLAQRNHRIELPDLAALAAQECVTAEDFDPFVCPYTPERAMITQFLLDCDMRGIIQAAYHPAIDEHSLLNIVRLAKPSTVTIVSLRTKVWRNAAAAFALPNLLYTTPYGLTGAHIDARHDGILIIDFNSQNLPNPCTRYAREFPRTIFYDSIATRVAHLNHWTVLAGQLFPTMPHPWAIRALQDNPRHWSKIPLKNFALFYNTCIFPEFITSQELLHHADDWQTPCDMNQISGELPDPPFRYRTNFI